MADTFGRCRNIDDPKEFINDRLICCEKEFDIVLENIQFIVYLLMKARDEFREEVLGKKSETKAITTQFNCANCMNSESQDGKSLRACKGCNSVFYCSRECQIVHDKPHHKKKCKEIIAQIEANKKIRSIVTLAKDD